jgi:hypothetical protein
LLANVRPKKFWRRRLTFVRAAGYSGMAKEVRFSQLVTASGKPETFTLWTDPKKNSAFMKAARENRVLTIVQKPTGAKKDSGLIA